MQQDGRPVRFWPIASPRRVAGNLDTVEATVRGVMKVRQGLEDLQDGGVRASNRARAQAREVHFLWTAFGCAKHWTAKPYLGGNPPLAGGGLEPRRALNLAPMGTSPAMTE